MLVCGSALPSAASIVGLSTPGAVAKTCACAHCGVRGHEEFECPTLFAAVFGEQMPGFLCDGRRDALAWGDDGSITAETALRWLHMCVYILYLYIVYLYVCYGYGWAN
jgi:hypothetical protein